jgi:hypothetical protein
VNHFNDYFMELGVQRQLTVPYSPSQNGVFERRNQMVIGVARSLLKAKEIPGKFWGEVVVTAMYILNRSMSKGAGGRTSYKLWTGSMPLVQHMCMFGCVAHVRDTCPHLKKLDDRSKPIIFVGFEADSMVYRAYDLATKRVHITLDVVFEEDASWSWYNNKIDNEFIIEYVPADHPEVVIMRYEALVPRLLAESPIVSLDTASLVTTTPGATLVPEGQASLGVRGHACIALS